jgi:hypothetical protein
LYNFLYEYDTIIIFRELLTTLSVVENESVRSVISECQGHLALSNPIIYSPILIENLLTGRTELKTMALASIRFAMARQSTEDTIMITSLLNVMGSLLRDSDMVSPLIWEDRAASSCYTHVH